MREVNQPPEYLVSEFLPRLQCSEVLSTNQSVAKDVQVQRHVRHGIAGWIRIIGQLFGEVNAVGVAEDGTPEGLRSAHELPLWNGERRHRGSGFVPRQLDR